MTNPQIPASSVSPIAKGDDAADEDAGRRSTVDRPMGTFHEA
jgi:hypothetical protein